MYVGNSGAGVRVKRMHPGSPTGARSSASGASGEPLVHPDQLFVIEHGVKILQVVRQRSRR